MLRARIAAIVFVALLALGLTLRDAGENEVEVSVRNLERRVSALEERMVYMKDERERLEEELREREDELEVAYSDLLIEWERFSAEADEWVVAEFRATGYAPFDDPVGLCSDGDPTSTRSGTYPTQGRTVAVDPSVIPLGTHLWIEGYGWRIAEDTGGAVKGNHVDIMFDARSDALGTHGTVTVVYPANQ